MSKKIWRECRDSSGCRLTCPPSVPNCTVIHDSACFPVKEAMAVVREVINLGKWDPEFESHRPDLFKAYGKCLRAVERMKKKAKGKK